VVGVVGGSLALLVALVLLAGGAFLRLGDGFLRDSDGYLSTSEMSFDSPGFAVRSQSVHLPGWGDDQRPQEWLGTVRVQAHALTDDGVFLGIARTSDVNAWLDGVAHTRIVRRDGDGTVTTYVDGGAPVSAARDQDFWVASADGPDEQTLTWEPEAGTWSLVVMNDQGTRPVSTDVSVGAELPVLDRVTLTLLLSGLVFLVGGVPLLWWGAARAGRPRS
jgi:hypothetical protein